MRFREHSPVPVTESSENHQVDVAEGEHSNRSDGCSLAVSVVEQYMPVLTAAAVVQCHPNGEMPK
jgi:hypothetical protein